MGYFGSLDCDADPKQCGRSGGRGGAAAGPHGRVGGGDRWAGEGRAGAASPALDGRRMKNEACGVPDSVLLCARSLCPGRSHFTQASGPGCNLSRTLILHIPLVGGRRGEEDKGDEESCRGQRREGGRRWKPSCPQTHHDLTDPGGGLEGQGPGWLWPC